MISFGYRSRILCILRSLVTIAVGLVLLCYNETTETMAKIIAIIVALVGVAGVIWALVKKEEPLSRVALIVSALVTGFGALLYLSPKTLAQSIVVVMAACLFVLAALQLAVFISAIKPAGIGWEAILVSVIIMGGAAMLFFNPFGVKAMCITAGCLFLLYGVLDLVHQGRIARALRELEKVHSEAVHTIDEALKNSLADDQTDIAEEEVHIPSDTTSEGD